MMNNKVSTMIPACILSGGEARRLGGKGKALVKLGNKNLIDIVISKLIGQVSFLAINVRDRSVRLNNQYTHIEDNITEVGGAGPLAGILSSIRWAKTNYPEMNYVLTVPVDCPFIPNDLVQKLYDSVKINKFDIIVASSNNNIHPVIALWSLDLEDSLEEALLNGVRKIDLYTKSFKINIINWNFKEIDPFFNINSHEDLIRANTYLNS